MQHIRSGWYIQFQQKDMYQVILGLHYQQQMLPSNNHKLYHTYNPETEKQISNNPFEVLLNSIQTSEIDHRTSHEFE